VRVPHPSPSDARPFVEIDLRSAVESIAAARLAGVAHFVYVSVAQSAPVMQAYQAARREAERALLTSGLPHTSSGRGTCSDPVIGGRTPCRLGTGCWADLQVRRVWGQT
jgi:hypothetical protein